MSNGHQILVDTLQLLLLLPLIWQLCRFLADPRELFSPKTVVSGGFVGLYVASYYFVSSDDREAFMTVDGYFNLLLLAALAEYAFWIGFTLGNGTETPRSRPFHGQTARCYALALIGIGFVAQTAFIVKSGGFAAFYGAPHGAGGAWASTSAYLYSLSGFMFVAMCLLWAMLVRAGLRGLLARMAFLAALIYSAFTAFAFGNRGDTIRLFLLLALPPLFLAGRMRVRRGTILLATAVTMTAVLLFPYLRGALYLGAEKSLVQAVGDLLVDEAVSPGRSKVSGQELFYAAAVVEAASEQEGYDFGYAWIYPFINLIPRAWWPDKPYHSDWSINRRQLVQQYAGWTVAGGAATTGIADAFLDFSWFSIVVWLIFGWWGGVIWRRATTTNCAIDVACLWAFLVMAVYFVTQGYDAAWHAWLFCMVPIWFLNFLMSTMAARPELGQVVLGSLRARAAHKLQSPAP